LVVITDQHAPELALQSALGAQVLPINAHFRKGMMENHSREATIMVRIVFSGLLNRFSCIQPMIPILEMGGFMSVWF
jgi:hypothetical protein